MVVQVVVALVVILINQVAQVIHLLLVHLKEQMVVIQHPLVHQIKDQAVEEVQQKLDLTEEHQEHLLEEVVQVQQQIFQDHQ